MTDKISVVETTKGYEKFLNKAADSVINRWKKNGGDNPYTPNGLKQMVITALEKIFSDMR